MNVTKVIMNEQHQLLPEQESILNEKFKDTGWEILAVPADGWTLDEMDDIIDRISDSCVVFVSPVPYMLMVMCEYKVGEDVFQMPRKNVWVFHNSHRVKKELSDGKVVYTVARTGWVLV